MPVYMYMYILEKAEIWWGVTDASHFTDNRIYSATQLVYSIKFKLSHAIS